MFNPFLQQAEFYLQFMQFLFIFLTLKFRLLGRLGEVVLHGVATFLSKTLRKISRLVNSKITRS
jgi:hypothetical protein